MSERPKNKNNEDAIEAPKRSGASAQSAAGTDMGAAAAIPGVTPIDLPKIEVGSLAQVQVETRTRAQSAQAERQAAIDSIPRELNSIPTQAVAPATVVAKAPMTEEQGNQLLNQIPGQGPVKDGGATFHEARM